MCVIQVTNQEVVGMISKEGSKKVEKRLSSSQVLWVVEDFFCLQR